MIEKQRTAVGFNDYLIHAFVEAVRFHLISQHKRNYLMMIVQLSLAMLHGIVILATIKALSFRQMCKYT